MQVQTQQPIALRSCHVLVIVACASFGACSWVPKGDSGLDVGIKDRGIASWYGEQFHGRQAANGEIFDMAAMTAAHRTLPLGSIVRVVNLKNGKHVRVRINDRGPYVNGRILDLSRAAAARLGMLEDGVAVVQVEVIGDHRPDLLAAAQESLAEGLLLFTLRREAVHHRASTSRMSWDRPNPAMTPLHRLPPNDMLLQRRWRWAPSILATDPAHRESSRLVWS